MRDWIVVAVAVASLFTFVVLDGGRGMCPPRIAIGSSLVTAGCP